LAAGRPDAGAGGASPSPPRACQALNRTGERQAFWKPQAKKERLSTGAGPGERLLRVQDFPRGAAQGGWGWQRRQEADNFVKR